MLEREEIMEIMKFDYMSDDLEEQMMNYADIKINKIGLKHKSVVDTNKDIVRFLKYMCEQKKKKVFSVEMLSDVKSKEVREYIDYLIENYSNASVSKYVTNIKNFVTYLVSRDIVKKNRFKIPLELPKTKKEVHFYDPIDAKKLVDAAKEVRIGKPKQNYAIMMMFFEAALRKFEVTTMKYADYVDYRDMGVFKLIGKGDKEAFVPLKNELRAAIDDYLESGERKEGSIYLFTSDYFKKDHISTSHIDKIIGECKKVSGVNKFSAHKFRHTMTTRIGREGGTLEDMQSFLRHSSKQTTENSYKQQNQLLEIQKLGSKFKDM